MKYRKFGNTSEMISAVGFGCMRLPEYELDGKWHIDQEKTNEMLMYAYEQGINYFDSAPYYCHANSERAVGIALKDVRHKILLSTKIPVSECKTKEEFRERLGRSLQNFQTEYIDFYHFWGINKKVFDEKVIGLGYLEEAKKAKEEGLIKHISFSFHDEADNIKYIIDTAEAYGVPMESMLVQYNLLDRSNEEMMGYAASKGLGVVAMGPVGGGRLAAPTDLYTKLTGQPAIATYELAFKFCLGNPDLSCALSGMQNLEMVEKNVVIGSDDGLLTQEQWQQLGEAMEQLTKFSELYCTGCAYCQPCPAKINIPKIFNMFTYANVYGLKDHAKSSFKTYINESGATLKDCKNCGFCEKKCPQKLKIREELKKVEQVLNGL